MLLVNLSTDLLRAHRIAFFGENVYILYVARLAQDCTFLLLLIMERPKNFRLADVLCNLARFQVVASKSCVFAFTNRPQYLVFPTSQKGGLDKYLFLRDKPSGSTVYCVLIPDL